MLRLSENSPSSEQAPNVAPLELKWCVPFATGAIHHLLAERPAFKEEDGTPARHPSRVYFQFGGPILFGVIRIHLQAQINSPRVVLEHPKDSEAHPDWEKALDKISRLPLLQSDILLYGLRSLERSMYFEIWILWRVF
jgi:hypothetical protein